MRDWLAELGFGDDAVLSFVRRAQELCNEGQRDTAKTVLVGLVAARPSDPQLRAALGAVLVDLEDYAGALAQCEEAIASAPDLLIARVTGAQALFGLNQRLRATHWLELALVQDPDASTPAGKRAHALAKQLG